MTQKQGNSWKYGNAVKEDFHTNQQDDALTTLRNKIMEMRKTENFEEFDLGIDEIYKLLNKPKEDPKKPLKAAPKQASQQKPGTHAKIHYEKDDLISFHDLFLSRPLVKACNSLDYDHPTRIQNQVVPNILENRDLLVNAVTGSGKTASYLLPILEKLHRRDMRTSKVSNVKVGKTRAIVLHPTRELTAQCSSMLESLNKFIMPKISYATIIGGSSIKKQENELLDKPDIIIATPGRFLDIIMNSKNIYFNNIETVILDEADRLLEMGFQEIIEQILTHIKKDSDVENIQTCLFSATLTKDIKRLASLALRDPIMISEIKQQNSVNAFLKLSHYMIKVPSVDKPQKDDQSKKDKKEKKKGKDKDNEQSDNDSANQGGSDSDSDMSDGPAKSGKNKEEEKTKKDTTESGPIANTKARVQRFREAVTLSLCLKTYTEKTIIFLNKKTECHRMFVLFTFFGLRAAEVHGNLSQKERMESVERFQSGEVDFLLSTDLLARGLDIFNVQAVINFSFPNEENRYVHRVGRTARAGNSGVAVTLCDDEERVKTNKVVKKCKSTVKPYSYPKQLKDTILTLINLIEEPMINVMGREREEFQLQKAEMELRKAQNMLEHKDSIYNRPKKEWFQSVKQKDQNLKVGKEEVRIH